jgi:hypothetical protein
MAYEYVGMNGNIAYNFYVIYITRNGLNDNKCFVLSFPRRFHVKFSSYILTQIAAQYPEL